MFRSPSVHREPSDQNMAALFATIATAIQLVDVSRRLMKEVYSFTAVLKDAKSELVRFHDRVINLE